MSIPLTPDSSIRVEPVWDSREQCRRFQIIIVNKRKDETFTVHKDMMGRDYAKLKLSDAEVFQLIQELAKSIQSVDFDPKIVQARFGKSHLKVVRDGGEGNDAG